MLTADGRVADVGTDAELTERCELYRMLITGPGDDVEGDSTRACCPAAAPWTPDGASAGTAGVAVVDEPRSR